MRLAIPVWAGRISPVFDVARNLLVLDIEQGREVSRHELLIDEMDLSSRVMRLARQNINVLICGAISCPLEMMLISSGIQVLPQTCGTIDEIIKAYLSGKMNDQSFLMPGCCGRRRRFRGRRGHRAPGY